MEKKHHIKQKRKIKETEFKTQKKKEKIITSYTQAYHKRKMYTAMIIIAMLAVLLCVRLGFLMIGEAEHYGALASDVQHRERSIKAERGTIYDRNGVILADNKPVCTISVIHSQLTDEEKVIELLSSELSISRQEVEKKVKKVSSREKIKSNVPKETADRIREYDLDGVMVDEDYKRSYPYKELASKVIGFTGQDNQGILGLEVKYDEELMGKDGRILTLTDAKGIEIENAPEQRIEPKKGKNLYLSLDMNIQMYAQQLCEKVMSQKQAKSVRMIVMNPNDGEIFAMVDVPEYNLNEPFILINNPSGSAITEKEKNKLLNGMWRNACISDSYEPGSTFKIVTATAALEENVVTLKDRFYCPGYKKVGDRTIRCHKTTGHGSESFVEGIQNSCNPVFMEVGARVGVKKMLRTYRKLGLYDKTGIDLPGEAGSIMHKEENIKEVELATMSFGQSIQITPLQLLKAASMVINGGKPIVPHFGVKIEDEEKNETKVLEYKADSSQGISKETSDTMKLLLESVVSEGGGNKAYIEGYRIGGKTATSEKLPRRSGKYISSFIGFAPADDPQVIAIILIDEPQGIYYGGTIAAPVVRELFENILPYLGIKGSA